MTIGPVFSDALPLVAALLASIGTAEWLARRGPFRHIGAALLTILLAAGAANAGLIPTYGNGHPVYDTIFADVAPLGIFWLLLLVDLRSVVRAGGPTLLLFVVGAGGTFVGALVAQAVCGGPDVFGALHHALTGMIVGTYVGGSVNFQAIAQEYDLARDPALFAGTAAVDNAMTTVWMAATIAAPRLLAGLWPDTDVQQGRAGPADPLPLDDEVEATTVLDLASVAALGGAGVATSRVLSSMLGPAVPDAVVLTTLALGLAQLPAVQRLRGTRILGLLAVQLFLAVIGALCDVDALVRMGDLAPALVGMVGLTVAVHGLVVFGAARALRIDPGTAAVASQANIGGGTTALALARSLGRADLELPAILVGSLGIAVGNYLGFAAAGLLTGS
ncbi:MAG: hypothetical protein RL562_3388 [Planctomycetota bacterium]